MSQGYLLLALGKRYIDECVFLAKTLRRQDDWRPISLVINPEDEYYAMSKGDFDKIIYFNPHGEIWTDCQNNFEKYCLYPRLYFSDYLPYDETIIVDSDVLCQYSTDYIWSYLSNRTSPIAMMGRLYDPNWHWGHIQTVWKSYGKHVPHVHGGFFYLRKDQILGEFFQYCRDAFWKYDEYGCKRWYQNGRVDEIIFAIAHSHFNMKPIEFDDFPIMTFNYTPDMQIPSKLQTEGGQNIEMNNYIPFVHMFDKMDGSNFQTLYKKIMHEV
jgi:hypothetical protein